MADAAPVPLDVDASAEVQEKAAAPQEVLADIPSGNEPQSQEERQLQEVAPPEITHSLHPQIQEPTETKSQSVHPHEGQTTVDESTEPGSAEPSGGTRSGESDSAAEGAVGAVAPEPNPQLAAAPKSDTAGEGQLTQASTKDPADQSSPNHGGVTTQAGETEAQAHALAEHSSPMENVDVKEGTLDSGQSPQHTPEELQQAPVAEREEGELNEAPKSEEPVAQTAPFDSRPLEFVQPVENPAKTLSAEGAAKEDQPARPPSVSQSNAGLPEHSHSDAVDAVKAPDHLSSPAERKSEAALPPVGGPDVEMSEVQPERRPPSKTQDLSSLPPTSSATVAPAQHLSESAVKSADNTQHRIDIAKAPPEANSGPPTTTSEFAPTAPQAPVSTSGAPAVVAEGSGSTPLVTARRTSPDHAAPPTHASGSSSTTANRFRQDDGARVRRENEDMRLMWLSLPSHDHPSYYSDTDGDASSTSSIADTIRPHNATGRAPYLFGRQTENGRWRPKQDEWLLDDDRDSSDTDDEGLVRAIGQQEKIYRTGNRGNKLRKGSRWVRKGKLGTASEARNEKDLQERFSARLKVLQRSQVESMLHNAQGPPLPIQQPDMLDGSDRLLLRDLHPPASVEETSTLLAPQLLRPILSTRALLHSHTLRHTFRNPHIGALSRTALDLRESESHLSRALARCLGAMEKANFPTSMVNGFSEVSAVPTLPHEQSNGRAEKHLAIDPQAIGVEGTHATEDELNPAFAQLDRLFVTKEGLPIPFGAASEDGQMDEQQQPTDAPQTVLTAAQQRDVIRAALECLHELGADSLEYVERLDEVRSRLAAVKQKRMQIWNALRVWALKREGDDPDNKGNLDAIPEPATDSAPAGGRSGQVKTNTGRSGKRQRVAA